MARRSLTGSSTGGGPAATKLGGVTEPVISVSELRCKYASYEAVRGIDFEVHRGELFALLGTNGAGKTTTLETVEGHRKPSAGRVRVFGLDPFHDRAEVRRRTGIMLQDSGFAADLTVLETLRLWRSVQTRKGDVAAVLAATRLEDRADRRVRQLSGGERRRLEFALAVLGQPELLFLDEPTTGLDPESRRATWEVVRELLRGGTTVLLTTHYLEEAESLAHRLAIMHEGRIAVSGTLSDVLLSERAKISFTADAEPQLPPLRGTVSVSGRQVTVRTAQLQRDLELLLAWARENQVQLRQLRAHHASLEDVFHSVKQPEAIR